MSYPALPASPFCPIPFPLSTPTIKQIPPIFKIRSLSLILLLRSSTSMKRSMDADTAATSGDEDRLKKIKLEVGQEHDEEVSNAESHGSSGFVNFDENLLYEIFKHADSRSLAVAACVSKLWNRTAQDERLWEQICTRHWAQVGYDTRQLRTVVLTLGGFRRLHSLYLWPLIKPPASASSNSPSLPPPRLTTSFSVKPPPRSIARWGKDEVHLSLGLLSIRYFEKMNFKVDESK